MGAWRGDLQGTCVGDVCRGRMQGTYGEAVTLLAAGDVVYSGGADGIVCKWSLGPPGTPPPTP
jgi:hypothetical protein